MMRKKYLYNRDGVISDVFPNGSAEIEFSFNNVPNYTFLNKGRYYHDGRLVPENALLSKYLRIGTRVKFSCHVLDRADDENQDLVHYQKSYGWYATMCWRNIEHIPDIQISLFSGLFSVPCIVESVQNRHAVLTTFGDANNDQRIELLASKFYVRGKRFSTSKSLTTVLNVDDKLFCDAVPCIEDESRFECKWFATCAFQGKRPRLPKPSDGFQILSTNYPSEHTRNMLERGWIVHNDDTHGNNCNQLTQHTEIQSQFKAQLPKLINLHTRNPCALFTTGCGFILEILSDEYAIMLGCVKRNVYQTILFHRGNAFLFKCSLARSKLTEIFIEGDRLRFIAVGAPANFLTDWIAVQVGVHDSTPKIEDYRYPSIETYSNLLPNF